MHSYRLAFMYEMVNLNFVFLLNINENLHFGKGVRARGLTLMTMP
jgi:hypothetical protein